jgi:hypothetical protein
MMMSPYFFEIFDESSKPIIVGVDHSFWVTGNSGRFSLGCCGDMRWISKNHRFFTRVGLSRAVWDLRAIFCSIIERYVLVKAEFTW